MKQAQHHHNFKTRPDDRRGTPRGRGTVEALGGLIGNPPFIPTDEQRREVRALGQIFPPNSEHLIAAKMGFSMSTLRRHFGEDMMMARADMLSRIGASLIRRALGIARPEDNYDRDQTDLQKFIMTRLGGWSTRVELSGPGGGPVQVEEVDFSKFTRDQLIEYGRLAAIQAGRNPDAIALPPPG